MTGAGFIAGVVLRVAGFVEGLRVVVAGVLFGAALLLAFLAGILFGVVNALVRGLRSVEGLGWRIALAFVFVLAFGSGAA